MLFGSADKLRDVVWHKDRGDRDLQRPLGELDAQALSRDISNKAQQKDVVTQDDGNCTGSLSINSPVSAALIPNSFVSITTFRDPQIVSL